MDERAELDSFLAKWRRRWPEWRIAEAFIPAARRDPALAWLCLRQELADAAWGGIDPRPGEAKLGWWVEELHGWTQGARRHPLAYALPYAAAPWRELAAALPCLAEARGRAAGFDDARALLQPYAQAVANLSAALDPSAPAGGDAAAAIATTVVAQRLVDGDPSAVPLAARAALGADAAETELRAHAARMLLQDWPDAAPLARADRIQLAMVRARLAAMAAGGDGQRPLPAWRSLGLAWRAARG